MPGPLPVIEEDPEAVQVGLDRGRASPQPLRGGVRARLPARSPALVQRSSTSFPSRSPSDNPPLWPHDVLSLDVAMQDSCAVNRRQGAEKVRWPKEIASLAPSGPCSSPPGARESPPRSAHPRFRPVRLPRRRRRPVTTLGCRIWPAGGLADDPVAPAGRGMTERPPPPWPARPPAVRRLAEKDAGFSGHLTVELGSRLIDHAESSRPNWLDDIEVPPPLEFPVGRRTGFRFSAPSGGTRDTLQMPELLASRLDSASAGEAACPSDCSPSRIRPAITTSSSFEPSAAAVPCPVSVRRLAPLPLDSS